MNASFFPEQLEHCMCGLGLLSSEGRPLVLCSAARPSKAFPGERGPMSSDKIGEREATSKGVIWVEFILSFELRRLPQAGKPETEQRWLSLSPLMDPICWHFNHHFLPEDSFVQGRVKPAPALTWNAKWWMGPPERVAPSHSTLGGINQVSRLPGACLCQTPCAVFSLVTSEHRAGAGCWWHWAIAAVSSLPLRCDGGSWGGGVRE